MTESIKLIIGINCIIFYNIVFSSGDNHFIIDTSKKGLDYSKNLVISDHM